MMPHHPLPLIITDLLPLTGSRSILYGVESKKHVRIQNEYVILNLITYVKGIDIPVSRAAFHPATCAPSCEVVTLIELAS